MITLFKAFSEGKMVPVSTPVRLPFAAKATIYGYVPCHHNVFALGETNAICCPPLGQASVVGNRIIFCLGNKLYRCPIFSTYSKCAEDKYSLASLYIPRLLELDSVAYVNMYKTFMKTNFRNFNLNKIDGINIIDENVFFFPKEDDYIFESSSALKGIGNTFVVITRRISPENGVSIYEVCDPNEVEIIE